MRCFSIILILIILSESFLPGRDVHELIKLPALIEHFTAHRDEDPDISFFGFIVMHYNDEEHHNNDHSTHHKLPFSDHHNCTHNTQVTILFHSLEIANVDRPHDTCEDSWCEIPCTAISSYGNSIWQPPKIG